jgi:3-hexulose-6-phosphate synthase
MKTIVQISLDLVTIDESLKTAEMAKRAGVDWLEAGTPLIIAEGMNGVRALRKAFPKVPIVADLKTMDGGYLEAELMAKAGAKFLEDLGCDFVIHHIGYDERRGIAAAGKRMPSPLDQLRQVVQAVRVPVQAVGGLTIEQAVRTPEYGAPLVVLGAPLTIDADSFKTASGDVESSLRMICQKVHGYGDVAVGSPR